MNRVIVRFPQLVSQRMKPANGTIPLHVTNSVPEEGFDTGTLIKADQNAEHLPNSTATFHEHNP